jgi:hypothetical protein
MVPHSTARTPRRFNGELLDIALHSPFGLWEATLERPYGAILLLDLHPSLAQVQALVEDVVRAECWNEWAVAEDFLHQDRMLVKTEAHP